MSQWTRRYIPSFKRRKLDGGREKTFLDTDGGNLRASGEKEEEGEEIPDRDDGYAQLRELAKRKEKIVGLRRHSLRHVVKRADGEEGVDGGNDTNPVAEIVDDVLGGIGETGGVGVTVTISIGMSIHVSTISTSDSTFITASTSWFTFDSSGGVSSALPTPTAPLPTTVATTLPALSSAVILPTTATPTPSPLPSISIPSESTPIPATTDVSVPTNPMSQGTTLSSVEPITTMTAIFSTLGLNMTDYVPGQTRTTTRGRTVIVYTETSSKSRSSKLKTSTRQSSTRISTSISTLSTVVPVDGEPTSPVSPTSTIDPDIAASSNNAAASVNEKLPPILGGVFGGLAGIGLILWALLFLLRRRRRNGGRIGGTLGVAGGRHRRAISEETGVDPMGEIANPRAPMMPFGAVLFGRSSTSTPPPTERGFVKISGRKLPSMYGPDIIPVSMAVAGARASASETGSRNVSGGTHATAGGTGSAPGSFHQDEDALVYSQAPGIPFTSSPVRTAMRSGSPALASRIAEHEPEVDSPIQIPPTPSQVQDPGEGGSRFPTPPPGAVRRMHSSIGADGVGRSLASQDGSKTSRFTEDV